MTRSARSSLLLRAFRVIAGAVLLATCSTETGFAPRTRIESRFDASYLFQAGGEYTIPIDQVVLTLRRESDNSIAFSRTLTSAEYQQSGGDLVITVTFELTSNPENFLFDAVAYSGGVEYYRASGSVTASANTTTTTPPITPTYTGPGAGADSVHIPAVTTLLGGQSATLTGDVYQGGSIVPGVPIAWSSSDSNEIVPVANGLKTATVIAPATGAGNVTITAKTPTGLTTSGAVQYSPAPTSIVKISGDGQSVPIGTQAAQPLVVEVRDPTSAPLPNVSVTFAVVAGPTGTSVSPTTIATNGQGRAQATLTAGTAAGPITVTATGQGIATPATFTATATQPVGAPATVTPNSAVTQSGIVNQLVTAPPSVIVRDAAGQPVPGATVTFAVAGGGGSLAGASQTTNASGIATVGSWRLGQIAGANTVTATVTGITPASFSATGTATAPLTVTKDSGDAQTGSPSTALANPLVVQVQDSFANVVSGATVAWSVTAGGGSVAPTSATTDVNGRSRTTWTLGATGTQTARATVGTLAPANFSATVNTGPPGISLAFVGIPDVGVGRTATVRATSSVPAGAGGVAVTLTSDATALVQVQAPATVTIPQGGTTADFSVLGVAVGSTTLRANATGYTEGTLAITVQNRNISVPPALNVPYGQTASLPIQLPAPAPAGGVSFTVVSSSPGNVSVASSPVTIAAGGQTANATLNGVLPGPATITVSNPSYVDGVTAATTTASLRIVQAPSTTINASFGTTLTINFESNGTPAAAPAPGITVSLSSANAACVAPTTPITIATGLVSTTAAIAYGGTATLPCTTKVLAQATNLLSDSITVTVNPIPGISVGTATVGSGLQTNTSFTLGASNHGGVAVTLTSDNASLLLAPNATTAGASQITIPVANGTQSVGFYVQGADGVVTTTTGTVTVSAPGFTDGTATQTAVPGGIILAGLPGTTTTLSPATAIYAYVGVPSGNSVSIQNRRAGAGPLTVTFSTPATGIGELLKAATAAGTTQTAQIQPGTYYTPFDTTSGGVAFHPLASGATTVSASAVGYLAQPNATGSVTVSQPTITVGTATVGSGLQTNTSFSLGAPSPAGLTITVTSDNPSILLSPNATTAGQGSISISPAAGTSSIGFYVQGADTVTAQTQGTVTVSAAGYATGTATMTVVQGGVILAGLPGTTTTLSPSNMIYAYVGVPSGNSVSIQNRRAGAGPLTVTFSTPANGIGELLKAATAAGATQTAQIQPGTYYTPFDTTSGGVAFHPLLSGATTVSVSAPGYVAQPNATGSVTVSQPTISVGAATVGSGLQTNTSFTLGAPNHGGVTVTLTSSNGQVLLSPNATTAGASQITIPVANGTQSVGFYVQGLEGVTQSATATVTVQASGFTDGTATVTVVQSGVVVVAVPATIASTAATVDIYAYVGIPSGNSVSIQNRRPGSALAVTFQSSNSAAATLVTTADPGGNATQTAQIVAGTYYTPFSVATGGVGLDPLTPGSSTISVSIPGFITVPLGTQQVTVQ
jgi:hypothetical protein